MKIADWQNLINTKGMAENYHDDDDNDEKWLEN